MTPDDGSENKRKLQDSRQEVMKLINRPLAFVSSHRPIKSTRNQHHSLPYQYPEKKIYFLIVYVRVRLQRIYLIDTCHHESL